MSSQSETTEKLKQLVDLSREYGSNPDFILAGGGNTSYKNSEHLYIKASGVSLANIDSNGFVQMKRSALDRIWHTRYSENSDEREKQVLENLMQARESDEILRNKRPSVETLLHDLLPYSFVVHTHPALVNGVTCSRNGKVFVEKTWGTKALWIPVINPGYILAREIKDKIIAGGYDHHNIPKIIFLQNHGVFVASNELQDIQNQYNEIITAIESIVSRQADREVTEIPNGLYRSIAKVLHQTLPGKYILGFSTRDILEFCSSSEAFTPVSLSFTPDHIVYSGHRPLFIENRNEIMDQIKFYIKTERIKPKIIALKNIGCFAITDNQKQSETARALFMDNVKIAIYSQFFGGHQFMPQENIDFIRNWEIEKFRAAVQNQK